MWEIAGFWVLAVLSVVTGIWVFRVDSMARATFLLLASFLCVAVLILLLDLAYLGALTVLMMVMEMAIMAVFMIMFMMNPAGLEPMSMLHNKRGALGISIGAFVALVVAILLVPWPDGGASRPADPTVQLGMAIMSDKMLVMMVTGVALFATMIAATVLATARGRYGEHPAADPEAKKASGHDHGHHGHQGDHGHHGHQGDHGHHEHGAGGGGAS